MIVIASNPYKEVMSADKIARNLSRGIKQIVPDEEVLDVRISDGGEELLNTFANNDISAKRYKSKVRDPLFRPTTAEFIIVNKKVKTAVIEISEASGLKKIKKADRDIMRSTSFGTGQLIKAALDKGCKRIYIGLGGSGISDGGIGALEALGARFIGRQNEPVSERPGACNTSSLNYIHSIDLSCVDRRLFMTEIFLLSDVKNKLTGERGAARVFGPQKGADKDEVEIIEKGLRRYASVIRNNFGIKVNVDYCGAGGGFAASFLFFPKVKLLYGVKFILDIIEFDKKISTARLVITGEGCFDRTTLFGKAPLEIAQRAKKNNLPVVGVFGRIKIPKKADKYFDYVINLSAGGNENIYSRYFHNKILPSRLFKSGIAIAERMLN